MKKKLLFVNEVSYLSTGFAVYGHELLSRLHETGKYDIAELGLYGTDDDPRQLNIPWKYYPNVPSAQDEAAFSAYQSRPQNQFGEFRFEKTCLDFQPHIVADISDWWGSEFIERSPFRLYFKWIKMAPVDSAPQEEMWIATFMNADVVFTYSEYGKRVLEKEGGGLINLGGIPSPGANLKDFYIIEDKATHKQQMGLPGDSFIVGTTMRNQERKLFPDLIEAFAQFIKEASPELVRKSYLYLHTGYPDVGWNIPNLLKQNGLLHKTLVTYICRQCKNVHINLFQDTVTFCRKCHGYTSLLPSVEFGVDRITLGKIMNTFDVYVQYATCEGFGMPAIEAASCGVPVYAVDYSAMSEIARKCLGYPIRVERMFHDIKVGAKRALPDNSHLVKLLLQYKPLDLQQRKDIRKAVEENFTYEKATKQWEETLDSIEVLPLERSWRSQPRIHQPNYNVTQQMNNVDFVKWAIINVAGRPELLNSYIYLRMVKDLNLGVTLLRQGGTIYNDMSQYEGQFKWIPYNRDDLVRELTSANQQLNMWEQERINVISK